MAYGCRLPATLSRIFKLFFIRKLVNMKTWYNLSFYPLISFFYNTGNADWRRLNALINADCSRLLSAQICVAPSAQICVPVFRASWQQQPEAGSFTRL